MRLIYLLGALPFLGILGGIVFANRVEPYVLGMPFILFWLLPAVWRYAKENRLHSQSDFFVSKYRSPALGVLISLVAVVAMVPYLAVQFQGLGIIVSEASYGSISSTLAIAIGAVAVTVYVIVSGIHGSAWTSTIKDILVLVVIVFL